MMRVLVFFSSLFKGLLFLTRPHIWLGFFSKPMLFCSNALEMSRWKSKLERKPEFDDFYSFNRNYNKRYDLYEHVINSQKLTDKSFLYLEFGVASGASVKWWLNRIDRADCQFIGFDTFEGLPEDWGAFQKGTMSYVIPQIKDSRAVFVKGLFQDTLLNFLNNYRSDLSKRLVIHLDADLFSATLYTLMILKPYLKKGDILMFDEFNVPNHEFFAFKLFREITYTKMEMIAAVNNYYQAAFIIE